MADESENIHPRKERPVTLEEARAQTLWHQFGNKGETKEMYLERYRKGQFDFIFKNFKQKIGNIQYCSDLHLEFTENMEFILKNPIKPVGDTLILAGDIIPFSIMNRADAFFDDISKKFKMVYWIPGNHEYYHSDINNRSGKYFETIRDNIALVNNAIFYSDYFDEDGRNKGLRLIFSTLWSHIPPPTEWQIERSLNDFRLIKNKGFRLSSEHYNLLHKESLEFIKDEMSRPIKRKTIVVTHHVPTFLNYPAKYKGDDLNSAFAVELFDFIESSGIDFWIYGHHHYNTPKFKIGTTTMLTNQLGYVERNEHKEFKNDMVIILNDNSPNLTTP